MLGVLTLRRVRGAASRLGTSSLNSGLAFEILDVPCVVVILEVVFASLEDPLVHVFGLNWEGRCLENWILVIGVLVVENALRAGVLGNSFAETVLRRSLNGQEARCHLDFVPGILTNT